jgi:hypothetical protein
MGTPVRRSEIFPLMSGRQQTTDIKAYEDNHVHMLMFSDMLVLPAAQSADARDIEKSKQIANRQLVPRRFAKRELVIVQDR